MGDGFANGVIRLENEPRAVFYAGQEISGSVLFELNQPLHFSVLTLTFLGGANVLWTEDQKEEYNGVVRHRLVKYIGHEEYFKYTEFLAGGQGISNLPAGSRAFPFKFRIPFSAPSSFTGEKGSVSYSITACLVNSDPMSINEELVKDFKVIAPLDLNVEPQDAKRPIDMEFEEVYGCDCVCSPGPMTIRVHLPARGYCPGQVIPVSVHIENESTTEINKIIFQLLTRERYRSTQPKAEYIPAEKILTTYKSGAILGKSRRNFTCDLTVPDMVSPNLENCSIIDVTYFFKIRIKLSGCNDDLQDESEIYLGLVPIAETTEGEFVHPLEHCLPIMALPDPSQQYEPVESVNPAFVKPNNTPYSPSNINVHQVSPYPPQNPPYPSQNPPYPSQNSPYPPQNSPYPPQNSPYPSQNPPYPSPIAPYPIAANPPSANKPFTNNVSYPSEIEPCPAENPSYNPSKTPPYPTDDKTNNPVTEVQPNAFVGYQIGFNASESLPTTRPYPTISPPYPLTDTMPGMRPPYPISNNMPGVPLPAGQIDLRIHLPPILPRAEPSAPPPST